MNALTTGDLGVAIGDMASACEGGRFVSGQALCVDGAQTCFF